MTVYSDFERINCLWYLVHQGSERNLYVNSVPTTAPFEMGIYNMQQKSTEYNSASKNFILEIAREILPSVNLPKML
ncbi:hypothetical protein chiPu_0014121 [Chiloscyllium punctatum]|uniref:Uncharacterized protein n=1 Tax=Chiloscyllium punctatum TaxID=137246 RepID=A0A401SZ02_CHIPU|nr:hypothetical protein [Chiloscyllium punctatum]